MSLLKGFRVWHEVDPAYAGKFFAAHGRLTTLVLCGALIPAGFAKDANGKPADADPPCPFCAKNLPDAFKRRVNKTYARLVPLPPGKNAPAPVAGTALPAAIAATKPASRVSRAAE